MRMKGWTPWRASRVWRVKDGMGMGPETECHGGDFHRPCIQPRRNPGETRRAPNRIEAIVDNRGINRRRNAMFGMRFLYLLAAGAMALDGVHKLDFDILKGANLGDVLQDFLSGLDLGLRDDTHDVSLADERAYYITSIKIGTPESEVKVLVDTGSSDLWVMSSKNSYCSSNGGDMDCSQYGTYDEDNSTTFVNNNTNFHISYLDNSFANGTWGQDTVLVGDMTIKGANLAVADSTDSNVGVFGIAYQKLESTSAYDNLPLQMKQQGFIKKAAYSLYLTSSERNTGSVLFGGIDHAKFTGDLVEFDVAKKNGDEVYLQIPLTNVKITVDPDTISSSSSATTLSTSMAPHPTIAATNSTTFSRLSSTAQNTTVDVGTNVLLDSGTTLTYFDEDTAEAIVKVVAPGATYSSSQGGYPVPCSLKQEQNSITFNFGDKRDIVVPMSDLVLQTAATGGQNSCMFGILKSSMNILGDNFLRHSYSVFNLDDNTISIAQMNYNDSEDIEVIE